MGGTGNLQPPFLLRARDLQGNSEDVEQKQKNRHDGNGNGKTGTEAAVRAAAPQAAEGCRRGETPSDGFLSALDLRRIFCVVQQLPRRLAAVSVQGHAQRQSQCNEENRQMEQNIHRLHMKDQPRKAVVADLKKRREQHFQRYGGKNHGAGCRQQEHCRKLCGKQGADLASAGSAGAERPNVRGKALQVTLVSGTHHRYREQNDQHIDEQKASLPRMMGRIGGDPVGVFIAERRREQGFIARCLHTLSNLVFINGHALRISPFLVRQNMKIDGAVTINGRRQSADTLKTWHIRFRRVSNVIGFTRGTGKKILPRAPGIAVPVNGDQQRQQKRAGQYHKQHRMTAGAARE